MHRDEQKTMAIGGCNSCTQGGVVKKFVRYREGAQLYSIGLTKFQQLAHHAGAVHKLDGISLVNCETFERYLEKFVV